VERDERKVIILKEVKHYICEICGTEYNDKIKAQHCEKGHCKPLEIIKERYLSAGNNAKGYPLEIIVKMADGAEQKYIQEIGRCSEWKNSTISKKY